ncbi:hypothetical protein PM082_014375 [Marasmius tenuissimus]|nr:hypothetical protein PM082_014375 [Marasmius tenuissimus]
MFSQFFRKAQNTRITSGSGSFSHVQGDQYNYSTTIVKAEEKERAEFDEFFYVKQGAIYRLRENGCYRYPREWDYRAREGWMEGRARADRVIYAAEIVDRPGRVFTMVQYRGPEAKKGFDEDFTMLVRTLSSDVSQVYGYNQSVIPTLILYNELAPIANFNASAGIFGQRYLLSLSVQFRCQREELWLDPGRGIFCRGPPGPPTNLVRGLRRIKDLPLTAELLQEDVLVRFMASLNSQEVDHQVVLGLITSGAWVSVPERVSQPTVFSTLTNTPIAVTNSVWTSTEDCLSDRKTLENGLTRFTFAGGLHVSLYWNHDVLRAWIAQASSVLYACGVSSDNDLRAHRIISRTAWLDGSLPDTWAQRQKQCQQTVYLFVRPPPFDLCKCLRTSSVHYWSFHEEGLVSLSHDVCHDLGLPVELEFCGRGFESWSFSNDDCKHLQQYQLIRGFDPATADFVHHLGYPYNQHIFHPLNDSDDSDGFEEVQQVPQCEPLTSKAATQSAGLLSALLSPLTSTVSSGSDIITVGF